VFEHAVPKRVDGTYRSGLCSVWIKVRNRATIAVQRERRERHSRNELVTTGFSDQDLWHRCIFFNFLAQPINMCLQCVRRHAGIVSPDLLQQNFSGDRFFVGPVEEPQDGGLLFGESW
jgi:hypothetical protein